MFEQVFGVWTEICSGTPRVNGVSTGGVHDTYARLVPLVGST